MGNAVRDANYVPSLIGASNADGTTPLAVYVDSSTNRLLVNATGSLTVDSEFPAAALIADNFANPTTTSVMAMGMAWDGATWDRLLGNSTDGLLVNLGANNDVAVSGTVTANAGTGTFAISASSLPLPALAATSAIQTNNTQVTQLVNAAGSAVTVTGNKLDVNATVTGGTGSSAIDDAAFAVASDSGTPAMGLFDDVTPDSVGEGDAGVLRMSANRNLYSTIRDAAGNERGVNVNASNQLSVSVDNTVTVGSHAVTNAGTFAVQAALAAETTKVIGTVNVAAAQTIAATQSGTWTVQPGNTANTTAWKVDGSAVIQPVSGTLTAVTTVSTVTNLSQMGGVAIALNTGTRSAGTQRVTIATDDLVPVTGTLTAVTAITNALPTGANVIGALTANQSVNQAQVAGTTTATNAGSTSAGTQRIIQATGATGTLSNVAASATSVTVLAANTARLKAVFYNDSTVNLYLKFGTTASATSFSYLLNAGMTLEETHYNGIITGIWASATGNARVTEVS